ncbi:MAG: Alanine dehydrogenase [Methanonatronarchaeales archaeon]|nr:Alanine dehydrogenase [Methanonatronarchaeales archaeon]
MPPKTYVDLPRHGGDMRSMPCYVEEPEALSVKWVNVHPDNPGRGLPTVMATIIYSDPSTGHPLGLMDGTLITDMRTGAAGAVSCRHLARRDSSVLGLVGAGVQARFQLSAITHVLDLDEVRVWSRNVSSCREFAEDVDFGNVTVCEEVEGAVSGSDVVATTTPSREPLLKAGWVSPGTHVAAIGADAAGKQELDPAILRRARLFVDEWEQARHSGEVNVPLKSGELRDEDVDGELGEVVAGKMEGRLSDDEVTVFDSTGLAVQDAVTAHLAFRKHGGLGTGVEMA